MFEPTPQGWKVLGNRPVLADLGPAARAMEVTAGADQQTELTGKDCQAAHLFCGLKAIDHFNRMPARLNIVGNQLSALAAGEIIVPGMRQTDPGTGRAQRGDGVFEGWPVQLDVTQLAGAEPFAERLGAILYKAFTHHPVGEMRTGRGVAAVAQFLLNFPRAVEGAGHAFEGELAAYFFRPQPAPIVQFGDGLDQRRGVDVETVAQHMNGRAAPGAGQFDAVDQLHAQFFGGRARFGEAFKGVVVGQRQDSHAVFERTRNQNRRRQGAIGGRAVAVQINIHGEL
eukprot:Opistho-2@7031